MQCCGLYGFSWQVGLVVDVAEPVAEPVADIAVSAVDIAEPAVGVAVSADLDNHAAVLGEVGGRSGCLLAVPAVEVGQSYCSDN